MEKKYIYFKKDKKTGLFLPLWMRSFYLLWILIKKSLLQIKNLFSSF